MKRFIAATVIALIGFGAVSPAVLARADEKKAHNLAIGSTAAAAYLLTHKGTQGIGVLAAGSAAYAWKKHHDAVKQRHDRISRRTSSRYHYRGKRVHTSRAYRYSHSR